MIRNQVIILFQNLDYAAHLNGLVLGYWKLYILSPNKYNLIIVLIARLANRGFFKWGGVRFQVWFFYRRAKSRRHHKMDIFRPYLEEKERNQSSESGKIEPMSGKITFWGLWYLVMWDRWDAKRPMFPTIPPSPPHPTSMGLFLTY